MKHTIPVQARRTKRRDPLEGRLIYENTRGQVVIDVDVQRIANLLGEKALFSKGKKARALKGAVTVKVVGETFMQWESF